MTWDPFAGEKIVTFRRALDLIVSILVTFVAIATIWSRGSGSEIRRAAPLPVPTTIDVIRLDRWVVDRSRGSGNVVLVEFTDYECPYCAQFNRDVAPKVVEPLVSAGRIRHLVINYPMTQIHPHARYAGEVAACAERQGRLWDLRPLLFSNQRALEAEDLVSYTTRIGLDAASFQECLRREAGHHIDSDVSLARRLGVQSTPTFFVGRINPDQSANLVTRMIGVSTLADFSSAIVKEIDVRTTS